METPAWSGIRLLMIKLKALLSERQRTGSFRSVFCVIFSLLNIGLEWLRWFAERRSCPVLRGSQRLRESLGEVVCGTACAIVCALLVLWTALVLWTCSMEYAAPPNMLVVSDDPCVVSHRPRNSISLWRGAGLNQVRVQTRISCCLVSLHCSRVVHSVNSLFVYA